MAGTYRLKEEGGGGKPTAATPPAPNKPAPDSGATGASGRRGPSTPVASDVAPPDSLPVTRLTSLDAYRGCIMILLAASGFGIARFASLPESAAVWHRPVVTAEGSREATEEDALARRNWWQTVAFHFDHPAWRSDFLTYPAADSSHVSVWKRWGVSLWDLIQPAFMFMVGVAMPFSYRRRVGSGESSSRRRWHALARAILLVLLGVFLYTRANTRTTGWVFTNVLAQIGLGYFFVYLMLGWRWWKQALAGLLILTVYWACLQYIDWRPIAGVPAGEPYDYAAVAASTAEGEVLTGRFQPWSKNANLAHAVDVRLLNALADPDGAAMAAWRERMQTGPLNPWEWVQMSARRVLFANPERFTFNRGGYQTLNFIPALVTMLLGVICGGVLLSPVGNGRKFMLLIAAAAVCLILGRVTGTYVCPIVKRIWTPSWTLFSGGYVIALLALFYLLFDLLPFRKLAFPLVIVGMNSLVMYLMGQLMRPFVLERIVRPHLTGLLETVFATDRVIDGEQYRLGDEMFGRLIEPCMALIVFWLIAFWLWRKRIFIRL